MNEPPLRWRLFGVRSGDTWMVESANTRFLCIYMLYTDLQYVHKDVVEVVFPITSLTIRTLHLFLNVDDPGRDDSRSWISGEYSSSSPSLRHP